MSVISALGGKSKDDMLNASLVAFVADEAGKQELEKSLSQLGVSDSHVARGSIDAVIAYLGRVEKSPQRLIVDISGIDKPMAALDRLAEACDPSVKVYVLGDTNDVNLYRALLQAGVCDYRFKPLTVDALRTWINHEDGQSVRQARSGKVVAVAGTRGGVGVTSVAAHLARYLTAGNGLRRVVYLDMDAYGGAGSTLLGVPSNHALSELLRDIDRVDPEFLQRTLTTNDGRLFVLASNLAYADAFTPDAGAISQLLEVLSQHFHYVVVDLPEAGGMVANEVLGLASMVCVVSDRSVHSARALTRLVLHVQARANAPVLHVLTNSAHAPVRGRVGTQEFSKAVSHPIALDIPYDGKLPVLAEDLGEPLPASSEMARAVGKLARMLTGELAREGRAKSKVAGWLRRSA